MDDLPHDFRRISLGSGRPISTASTADGPVIGEEEEGDVDESDGMEGKNTGDEDHAAATITNGEAMVNGAEKSVSSLLDKKPMKPPPSIIQEPDAESFFGAFGM